MDSWLAEALSFYGVEPVELLSAQKGYRNTSYAVKINNGSTVNLIIYKHEPDILHRIKCANAAGNYLHSSGLNVRYQIDPRTLVLKTNNATRYGCLYNYLKGSTISWDDYTQDRIKSLGKNMAEIHKHLSAAEIPKLNNVSSEYKAIVSRMEMYFTDTNVQTALSKKLELKVPENLFRYFTSLLEFTKNSSDQQPLHMDFVRSNILFEGSEVCGILDFEKVASGPVDFDLARTLAFLYVDCKYKNPEQIYKYFIVSGYQKRGGGSFQKIGLIHGSKKVDLLQALVGLFWFYDFYKFLRHNPYESLLVNEHYLRTVEFLKKEKLLQLP